MNDYVIKRVNSDEDIQACYEVMAELRPHLGKEDFLPAVRRMEKEGYALACVIDEGEVRAVAGYRIIEMLRTGRMLEIDDLVTSSATRSRGCGKALFEWVVEEARRQGCSHVELDSGVQRLHAHRFYFRQRMHVLGFHFSLALSE